MVSYDIFREHTLRIDLGIVVLAILLLAGGASALSNSGGGSWQYYKDITISNTGTSLSDYQELVSLTGGDFPTNAQTSGGDIRFTDAIGSELSYWIESWDYSGGTAQIWVKVPSIPAGETTTIRMYYGNPSASGVSNGVGTFILFDDFSGATINSGLWTTEVVNSASLSQSGGELIMTVGATQQGNTVHIKSNFNFAVPYRLHFKAKLSGYGDHFTHSYDGATDATWSPPHLQAGQNFIMYWLDQGGDPDTAYNTANNDPWTRTPIITGTANVYSIFEILATTSAVKYVVDDTLKATHTTNIPTIALPLYFRLVTEGGAPWTPSGATQWMDYVFLAKYASSEPSVSVGAEMPTEIPANIDIDPDTLNLASKGKFTAFITLPDGYNVADIDVSTVVCEGAPLVKGMVSEEDSSIYIAKFNREDLVNVATGDEVTLKVTGKVYQNGNLIDFEGSDTIRVTNKGK